MAQLKKRVKDIEKKLGCNDPEIEKSIRDFVRFLIEIGVYDSSMDVDRTVKELMRIGFTVSGFFDSITDKTRGLPSEEERMEMFDNR